MTSEDFFKSMVLCFLITNTLTINRFTNVLNTSFSIHWFFAAQQIYRGSQFQCGGPSWINWMQISWEASIYLNVLWVMSLKQCTFSRFKCIWIMSNNLLLKKKFLYSNTDQLQSCFSKVLVTMLSYWRLVYWCFTLFHIDS
jgi:hypothetical protein